MKSIPGFTLKKLIHSSRFSQVYRANRISDDHCVILRTLNIDNLCGDQFKRLSKSRRLLEKFDHPNVVKVEGWLATGHGPVLVLEDIGGIDLFQYQSQYPDHCLSLADFFEIALQLCDCLAEIHSKGIVHKDLHLGNIIIEPETKRLQVIDFDLSDRLLYQGVALKKSRRVKGAIHFLPPELTGRVNMSADHRVDFYSMGVCLYRLLTGKKPVQGDQLDEVVHKVLAGEVKNISEHQPDIPNMIVEIVNKLMSVNPEDRYNTAQGIKSDLEFCFESWQALESVPQFELATRDRPGFFKWPERFYGREDEKETLSLWQRNSEIKLVSIAGEPGIGKTALMESFLGRHVEDLTAGCPSFDDEFFILKAKLVEDYSNASYQLIRGLLEDWLISNDINLNLSQEALIGHLSKVVDIQSAHSLANIIVSKHELDEEVNRESHQNTIIGSGFNKELIAAVKHWLLAITNDKQILLVVDDFHWADYLSCEVLKYLLSEQVLSVKVIALSRNNKPSYLQPFNDLASSLSQKNIRRLTVKPLEQKQLFDLLICALDIDIHTAMSLTQLLMKRTLGYPLYVREYMLAAYYSGHMSFHFEEQLWRINLGALESEPVTDEMAEIIRRRMANLSGDCLEVLRLAACTGFEFKERFIVELIGKDHAEETFDQLAWGLECGILLRPERSYNDSDFQFCHDRLRETIYDSIPKSIRAMLHRTIARQLYKDWQQHPTTRLLDQLVNQYNLAISKVSEPDELLIIANLNRQAAEHAVRIGSWQRALECSQAGLSIMSSSHQMYRNDVFVELNLIQAETEFLIGDKNTSLLLFKRLVNIIQLSEQNDEKKSILLLRIQRTRFILFMAVLDWSSAYQVGLETLAMSEFSEVLDKSAKSSLVDLGKPSLIEKLKKLSFVSNKASEARLSFLANLSQFAVVNQCKELLKVTNRLALQLILKSGHGGLSPLIIANIAAEQVSEGEYSNALVWADLIDYLTQQKPEIIDANTLNIIAGLVSFYGSNLKSTLDKHLAGVTIGFNRGEVLRAIMNHSNSLFIKYFSAMPLTELKRHAMDSKVLCDDMMVSFPVAKDYLDLIDSLSNEVTVVENLSLNPVHETSVSDNLVDTIRPHILGQTQEKLETAAMRLNIEPQLDLTRAQDIHSRHQFYFVLVKHFWRGGFDQVKEIALSMYQKGILTSGFIISVDAYVLTLLSLRSTQLTAQDISLLEHVVNHLMAIHQAGAEHFAFIKPLVDAELGAMGHRYIDERIELSKDGMPLSDAMANYSVAIDKAHSSGFLHYEGLMNQRLGEFWLKEGMDQYGHLHMKRAYALYQQWQNMTAVTLLEREYPQLFASYDVSIELLSSVSLGSSQYLL